jgi:hypothetical protein
MDKLKGLWVALVAVAVVAVVALVLSTRTAPLSVSVNGGEPVVVQGEKSYGGTTNLDSLTLSGTLTAVTLTGSGNATVGGTLGVTGASTLTGGATVGSQYSSTAWLSFLNATATAPSANYCDASAEGGRMILATSTSYVRLYTCVYHASSTRGWDYATLTD